MEGGKLNCEVLCSEHWYHYTEEKSGIVVYNI